MREALALAREAAEAGEVPVGCVVFDEAGEIIGRGRNRREEARDACAHAEVEAIRAACAARGSWNLSGCGLAVTLEPCPMCAGAISQARVHRLIYGAADERYGCAGSVYRIPEDPAFMHFCRCEGGLLAEECAAPIRAFFDARRGGT